MKSKSYLYSIVLVAVIGGLLFGYDTAVISGAEKGLQAFFMGAQDFQYTDFWHGFTSSSALIGCIIGSAMSGMLATRLGRKRTLVLAGGTEMTIRTSTQNTISYLPLPEDSRTYTGIFSYYTGWQIQLRDVDDIFPMIK